MATLEGATLLALLDTDWLFAVLDLAKLLAMTEVGWLLAPARLLAAIGVLDAAALATGAEDCPINSSLLAAPDDVAACEDTVATDEF